MESRHAVDELTSTEQFFGRSTQCLLEADSAFAPHVGMLTVAQHVAHTAQTVDWCVDGAFSPRAFDLDFPGMMARALAVTSLDEARGWLGRAFAAARERFGACSAAELAQTLPENPIMNGPRYHVLQAVVDHTGHHRGALAVYARLLGRVPAAPYGG